MSQTVIKVNPCKAETLYINHPTSSYGIFCFNSQGDLFLNSDWGFYGYAWRSYGDDFKEFLGSTNADYILQKFELNFRQVYSKKINAHAKENLLNLINELINYCKTPVEA